jgi:cytochrome P450
MQIDITALVSASVAAVASFLLFRNVIRPLPPGILQASRFSVVAAFSAKPQDRFDFFIKSAALAQGRPLTFYMMWLQRVTVVHPAELEHVLSSAADNYVKGSGFELLQRVLGNGLVTITDAGQHARHRRLVSPAFAPVALARMSNDIMRVHALALVEEITQSILVQTPPTAADRMGKGSSLLARSSTARR